MQTADYIWHNGTHKKWHEATVHVLTHTLHYGGGAFEGIRVYQTDKGPAIFRLREHVERLLYSAAAVGMNVDYSSQQLCQIIVDLVRKNRLEEGYIRPLFYFGYKQLGVQAKDCPVELVVACWPWPKYLNSNCLDVKTSQYARVHPNSTIADAKLCGHYLNSQLAALEIQGTNYHEVLLLDYKGHVAEGSAENIFIVRGDTLLTPKSGNILVGITRQTIIELAQHYGYDVVEDDLTTEAVVASDEAFFTGTAVEIAPIGSLDDKLIGDGKPGRLSQFFHNKYLEMVRHQLPQFAHYLTFVE